MTAEEFTRSVKLRGYPGKKKLIDSYLAAHPKDDYTEDDLIDYYYASQSRPVRRYHINGLCADGQDKFSPSNM